MILLLHHSKLFSAMVFSTTFPSMRHRANNVFPFFFSFHVYPRIASLARITPGSDKMGNLVRVCRAQTGHIGHYRVSVPSRVMHSLSLSLSLFFYYNYFFLGLGSVLDPLHPTHTHTLACAVSPPLFGSVSALLGGREIDLASSPHGCCFGRVVPRLWGSWFPLFISSYYGVLGACAN